MEFGFIPTKEFYSTGHVNSNNVAKLPEGRRECLICLEDFEQITTSDLEVNPHLVNKTVSTCGPHGSDCRRLHMFHQECISTWLEGSNTCPACRIVVYKKQQDENIDVDMPLDDSANESEEPDDYADYLRHIVSVIPTRQGKDEQPWYEAHSEYLEDMTVRRMDAYQAGSRHDNEVYATTVTLPDSTDRPGLSGCYHRGVIDAAKLQDALRRFFWTTFALHLPNGATIADFGVVCHPDAMRAWRELHGGLQTRDRGYTDVAELKSFMEDLLNTHHWPFWAPVKPLGDAMISEILLAFEPPATAAERRSMKEFERIVNKLMRRAPEWMEQLRQQDPRCQGQQQQRTLSPSGGMAAGYRRDGWSVARAKQRSVRVSSRMDLTVVR